MIYLIFWNCVTLYKQSWLFIKRLTLCDLHRLISYDFNVYYVVEGYGINVSHESSELHFHASFF